MNPAAFALLPMLLALVLAFSAVAKLRDQDATLNAIRLLRLPRFLLKPFVGWLLPSAELVLAAALLAPWSPIAVLAGVACLLLMVIYWLVIARALRFDPRPNCGCFGRIGDQSVSERTLFRNTLLVVASVAGLFWTLAGHTVPQALGGFTADDWWWVLVVALVASVAVLILGRGRPAAGPAAPPPAPSVVSAAPPVPTELDDQDYIRLPIPAALLKAPDGQLRTLQELAMSRPQLLVFFTCGCSPAAQVLEQLPQWERRLPQLDLVTVATFQGAESALGERPTWYDHGSLAYSALGATGHPVAVLLGVDGALAGGPVAGLEIAQFVDDIEAALAGSLGDLDAAPIDEGSGH